MWRESADRLENNGERLSPAVSKIPSSQTARHRVINPFNPLIFTCRCLSVSVSIKDRDAKYRRKLREIGGNPSLPRLRVSKSPTFQPPPRSRRRDRLFFSVSPLVEIAEAKEDRMWRRNFWRPRDYAETTSTPGIYKAHDARGINGRRRRPREAHTAINARYTCTNCPSEACGLTLGLAPLEKKIRLFIFQPLFIRSDGKDVEERKSFVWSRWQIYFKVAREHSAE